MSHRVINVSVENTVFTDEILILWTDFEQMNELFMYDKILDE